MTLAEIKAWLTDNWAKIEPVLAKIYEFVMSVK